METEEIKQSNTENDTRKSPRRERPASPWRYTPPVEEKKTREKKGSKTPLTYEKMVLQAIQDNKSRKGTDIRTITAYITANYKVSDNCAKHASRAAKKLVEEGTLKAPTNRRYSLVSAPGTPKKKTSKPSTRGKAAVKKAKKISENGDDEPKTKRSTKKDAPEEIEEKKQDKKSRKTVAKGTRKKSTEKDEPKTKRSTRKSAKKSDEEEMDVEKPEKKPRNAAKTTRSKKPSAEKSSRKKATKTEAAKEARPKRGEKKTAERVEEAEKAPVVQERPRLPRQQSSVLEVAQPIQRPQVDTKLEIVFCFDTTGSMYEILDNVRDKIGEIVGTLFKDIKGIRIGVIAFGDYTQTKEEPYVIQIRDFSTDIDEIVSFVYGVEQTYGGDWEEAYEYALKKARTKMGWTDDYSRALVMIGKNGKGRRERRENRN
eukprot:TRINITY_DN718_c0_g1_i2.p1 TRINITY_DN718_c0_g1~~TRINITY_DN718_c0_g1_i2.p1  ORF type:complete len:428 (-),score=122.42 TRINITY_DN718_c0_g1_i2:664-1947(-)